MTSEPRVIRIVPLTRVIDGRLCWLVVGSLVKGRPEYKEAPDLEQLARRIPVEGQREQQVQREA